MEVCSPGPEGRNMTHLLAFDGHSRERQNLACPYCSFDLYAMKTCSVNDEISHSFSSRDFAVYIGSQRWQPLTALVADSFVFQKFGKIGQPHPSTPESLMFFVDFEIFEKAQMRGRIRKEVR